MDKKHIIDEIIRTTKENDGIPLGIRTFVPAKGIKRSDARRLEEEYLYEDHFGILKRILQKSRILKLFLCDLCALCS